MNQKTSRLFRKWCRRYHPGEKRFYREMKRRWNTVPAPDRKALKDGLAMDIQS